MKFLWLLVTSFLKISLSKEDSAFGPRLVGGQDAYVGQFPYAAAIYVHTSTGRYFCGGTLINVQWILTSGHCVTNAVSFTIQLGSNNLASADSSRVTVATSEYFYHPEFNPDSFENDIALIKLRLPVTLTDYIQTIDLPTNHLWNSSGVTIFGWGQISDSNAELSEKLQYVNVVTIPNVECQVIYGSQINDNMVCVRGNYNEGTCTGDTGGAMLEWISRYVRVVAIASFISGNGCESTDPSGYTRTFPYTQWIYETIETN